MTKSWLEHQCFQWSFTNQMIDHSHLCILGLALFGLGVSEDAIAVVSHFSQVKIPKENWIRQKKQKAQKLNSPLNLSLFLCLIFKKNHL